MGDGGWEMEGGDWGTLAFKATIHYPLSTVHYSLFPIPYSLFPLHYSLFLISPLPSPLSHLH